MTLGMDRISISLMSGLNARPGTGYLNTSTVVYQISEHMSCWIPDSWTYIGSNTELDYQPDI